MLIVFLETLKISGEVLCGDYKSIVYMYNHAQRSSVYRRVTLAISITSCYDSCLNSMNTTLTMHYVGLLYSHCIDDDINDINKYT